MEKIVAPSLLSANFGQLNVDIEMVNRSQADWFHCDIMDGLFVPNLSYGFPIIEQIKRLAKKPLDVHLMIVDPDRYLERFKESGADILTVHIEACTHLHRTIQKIKALGMKAGIALNPHTAISQLEDIIIDADMVLIMSVNPGFGGQKFIENSYEKISRLREMAERKHHNLIIEVDGGVDFANAAKLRSIGANALVAGNAIFKAQNPEEAIAMLKMS
jgi:ribulose-phosphate 3-epimerase